MAQIRLKKVGKQGVSPVRKQGTVQQTTGFGYVLIPEGVDRDKFVDTCFRTNKMMIARGILFTSALFQTRLFRTYSFLEKLVRRELQ